MTETAPKAEPLRPGATRSEDPGIVDTSDSGKSGRGFVEPAGSRSEDGGAVDTSDGGKIDRSLEDE